MAKIMRQYEDVPATPVKSFFVEMLTRDISLTDAILDLLDNCVDGIIRKTKGKRQGKYPYKGFFAEIHFDKDSFSIHDNCGGIPWSMHEYAFRMGKANLSQDRGLATVGTYGIGMKRAIFKMGKSCLISTRSGKDAYEVDITPTWIQSENEWMIPVRPASESRKDNGTTIVIGDLYAGIASQFGPNRTSFLSDFVSKVSTHYAFIINKGFRVKINGTVVIPKPTELVFAKRGRDKAIRPFIYRTRVGEVDVFLAIGFTRPIPSEEEVQDEQQEARYSSLDAGWTVVCNDRAVLYCDRSEMTGWGEAGVPKYHTQFIAISGIVEFKSDDASKLPTTTTKRGIDMSSPLYLQVKNKMREGMTIFTNYTNKWKGRELAQEARSHVKGTETLNFGEIKERADSMRLATVKTRLKGKQYKPSLPMPPRAELRRRRISFAKDISEIETVTEYLDLNQGVTPSCVGEECFNLILAEAKK